MNYIITGGSGFIGTHLTNLIKENVSHECSIYNLDIAKPGQLPLKDYKPALKEGQQHAAIFVECDVRKPIMHLPFTPTKDDILFNLAAVHRTPGHPAHEYFETNIRGAENVCAFAERYGIRKIVFTSSIAPYGAAEELKEETTLPTPNTPYGISKLVAEKIHTAWQVAGKDRQLVIMRPGVVFGKGENGNFTRLYQGLCKHTFAYPGRKDTVKACIYVKELVRFMLYCIGQDKIGAEIYNCCYEPAYTIEQIVVAMKRVTRLARFVPYIPNTLIIPIATVAQCLGAPMGICPARVRKLQISTNICGRKLAESGYQFKYVFEDALKDWYMDNDCQWLE